MKSMVRLTLAILKQVSEETGISTDRDVKTIHDRVEKEGISFLTITLPAFEKELLPLLVVGAHITPTSFPGFRKRGGVPEFLGGLLRVLFSDSGKFQCPVVPEDWAYQAQIIRSLRQITLLHKKVELECTPERTQKVLQQYIETDAEIVEIFAGDIDRFRKMSERVLGPYLRVVEQAAYDGDFAPRHSSGALSTREKYNERFSNVKWTERLQKFFPYWEDLTVNWRDDLVPPTILSPAEEVPSRVTTVPKTMKGPRVIAMEPVWNQYIQQGLLGLFTRVLGQPRFQNLFEGFGWEYQDWNRLLAKVGSENQKLATVDLSEASDRVSYQLVKDGLLGATPYLSGAVSACRSERADVNGEVISLKKFASMGSSLTFPIESMVFFVIVHLAWERYYGFINHRALSSIDGVRVYGDDIICPRKMIPFLLEELQTYGLKVNPHKSFWTGFFRESCGSDWYAGISVNTVKAGVLLPTSKSHSDRIYKAIELHNNLVTFGWYEAASIIEKQLKSLRYVPHGPVGSKGTLLYSNDESQYRLRYNANLHRLEIYSLMRRDRKPSDPLDGYGALRKFFLSRFVDRESDHLLSDGRSQCVGLHTGWISHTTTTDWKSEHERNYFT
jgi:hypothetical protein